MKPLISCLSPFEHRHTIGNDKVVCSFHVLNCGFIKGTFHAWLAIILSCILANVLVWWFRRGTDYKGFKMESKGYKGLCRPIIIVHFIVIVATLWASPVPWLDCMLHHPSCCFGIHVMCNMYLSACVCPWNARLQHSFLSPGPLYT